MLKTRAGDIIGNLPGETTRFLKRKEVELATGLSKSAIYEAMNKGTFPLPVPLGPKSVAWVSTEITAWIAARIIPVEERLSAMKARRSGPGRPKRVAA